MSAIAFALSAAVGSAVRAVLGWRLNGRLPLGTLAANVLAAFGLGLLVGPGSVEGASGPAGVALLGALGTWSAFANEVVALLRRGEWATAGGYLAATLVLGVAAAGAGLAVAS